MKTSGNGNGNAAENAACGAKVQRGKPALVSMRGPLQN